MKYDLFRSQKNKYKNSKIKADGKVFGSVKEYNRWCELKLLERAGKIKNLRTQVPYELIPSQWEEVETNEVYVRGPSKGQKKKKRACVERGVTYVADFVYEEKGKEVVEDAKGFRTEEYKIKKKLMLWTHKIKVVET